MNETIIVIALLIYILIDKIFILLDKRQIHREREFYIKINKAKNLPEYTQNEIINSPSEEKKEGKTWMEQ